MVCVCGICVYGCGCMRVVVYVWCVSDVCVCGAVYVCECSMCVYVCYVFVYMMVYMCCGGCVYVVVCLCMWWCVWGMYIWQCVCGVCVCDGICVWGMCGVCAYTVMCACVCVCVWCGACVSPRMHTHTPSLAHRGPLGVDGWPQQSKM